MESSEESAAVAAATAARMRRLKEIEQLKQLKVQMENMTTTASHHPTSVSHISPLPPQPFPPVPLPTRHSTVPTKSSNQTQSNDKILTSPVPATQQIILNKAVVRSVAAAPVTSNRVVHSQEEPRDHLPRTSPGTSIPVRAKSAFAIRSNEQSDKHEINGIVHSSVPQSSATSRQPPIVNSTRNPLTNQQIKEPSPSSIPVMAPASSSVVSDPVPSVITAESKHYSPPVASPNPSTRKDRVASAAAAPRSQQAASGTSSSASTIAPSGRATVAGHYSTSTQPQKSQPRISLRSASTNTNIRPNPAAGLSTGAGNTATPADEMTEAQKAAYLLRMQFLGTKVFVDPQAGKAKPSQGDPNHATSSKPSSSSETSPVRSHSVSVAPVDPHARFLAPTASRLQSVAPAPPTVDEILEQEEQAAQALEAKLRAQRERMEKSKKEVAKYKAEQAVKEANQREAAARAEEEAKASEQRRRENDRVRRDAEKKKVAAFQQAKLAREQAKVIAEARKAEVEANERKRAVEAYLKSKAEQQAQQETYERNRLEAIEQRIKQIAPNMDRSPTANVVAPSTSGNTYAFPVPQAERKRVLVPAAAARKPKPAAANSANTHGASIISRSPLATLQVPDSAHSPVAAFTAPLSPLTSESVSFFSSTADVTAAFIAAQQEKEKKLTGHKSGAKTSGSYAAIHLSEGTKPAKSKRLSGASRPAAAATAMAPQSRISDIESALEAKMDQYADDIIFEAEEEDQP